MGDYFDPTLSDREIARRYPRVMKSGARFDARAVREGLLNRGESNESGFVRFAYRPFDNRWLYWEKDTKLLDEKRAEYRAHVVRGEHMAVGCPASAKRRRAMNSQAQVITRLSGFVFT